MNEREKDILDEKVKMLSKNKKVLAVFFFGSKANGNPREDSDIDLAVLTGEINEKDKLGIKGESDELFDVSLFWDLPLIIQFRILKGGKVLFCRNKKDIYDARTKVIREYLDFLPFANKFYRRVINGL